MFIKVKAHPESKKEKVTWISDNSLEIYVKEKAERNEANNRIWEIVASLFSDKRLKMIVGHKTQNKIFEVED